MKFCSFIWGEGDGCIVGDGIKGVGDGVMVVWFVKLDEGVGVRMELDDMFCFVVGDGICGIFFWIVCLVCCIKGKIKSNYNNCYLNY